MRSLKQFLVSLVLGLPMWAGAQSALPACQGSHLTARWDACIGAITHPNGDKQAGEFRNGRLNGPGMEVLASGYQYIGQYKDDLPDGHGTETFPEGHRYIGQFKDGKYHGQGDFAFSNRNRYAGDFRDGKPNGRGRYSFANGDVYEGEFRNGLRSGRGSFTYADGEKYVGEFQDGDFNGLGIEYRANGSVARSGRWRSGDLAEAFAIDPKRFEFAAQSATSLSASRPAASSAPERPPAPVAQVPQIAQVPQVAQVEPAKPAQPAARPAAAQAGLQSPPEQSPQAQAREPAPALQASSQRPAASTAGIRRLALVIGNDSYRSVSTLDNARSDARSMAKALEATGFKVSLQLDLTERGMKEALRNFRAEIQGGDEVVLFFAGHGVQIGAANYLLPVDIRGQSEEQVKDEAIALQRVLDDLSERRPRFSLAVIDACRNNPLKSNGRALGGRGLAAPQAASGQMVIFSAGSGQEALDRLGDKDKNPNGLFTRIFLREMLKPGVPLDRVVRSVRTQVVELAKSIGHEQVPATYDQTLGDFFFVR